jgi:hypothetical protein
MRKLQTYALLCPAAGAVKIHAGTSAAVALPLLPGFSVEVGPVLPGNHARALRRFQHLHIQHGWFWLAAELEQWLAEQSGTAPLRLAA